jgi:hypothetical protein
MAQVIRSGSVVEATTAGGQLVRMVAIGPPIRGRDFPVVWVCTEDEWSRSQDENEAPDAVPWPLTAVRILEPA